MPNFLFVLAFSCVFSFMSLLILIGLNLPVFFIVNIFYDKHIKPHAPLPKTAFWTVSAFSAAMVVLNPLTHWFFSSMDNLPF